MRTHLFVAAVVGLVLAAWDTSAESAELKKIATIEGITEYHLDNGLKVLLYPDQTKASVTINLTIFVGSRHEGYGEAGMAHLLEHMLFKGTPTHPNVPKVLQERGARFNGTTWLDRTNYYETLPANDNNLEFAIRLEADRMMNSNIKGEDLASEMTVVRSEFESGENSPTRVLSQRMMSVAYQWHNYGKATIGNRADIERVPVEYLRPFYKKFYQPDNAMLVVAGKFDEKKALAYTTKYFGAIPAPKRKLQNTYTEEPPQDGERVVTLRRVGDVAVAGVLYHIPSGAHPDYAPIDALVSILAAEPAGRLYKALVETKRAASINAFAFPLHDPGVLQIGTTLASGNDPQAILGIIFDELDKVVSDGVSQKEVDRARQQLLKFIELAAQDTAKSAVELSEWAAQGDWRLKFLYRDRVEKITPDDVQRVAALYLKPNNRTVGMFLPVKTPSRISIPATPNLAEMIGDYKGRAAVARGEAFDPSPENIDARTQRLKLPGGTKVALLPKKTKAEAVNVQVTLRYGNTGNLKGLKTACEFLPTVMLRGTKSSTRQQIQDELDRSRSRMRASGQAGTVTFSIQTKRGNLSGVLELLRQILREPSLPQDEFSILKQSQLTQMEQQLTNPQTLALRTLRRAFRPYAPDDPRYEATIKEEIEMVKATTIDRIKTVYEEFLGAENAEVAVVGDFDVSETKAGLNRIFADWKATKPYARIPERGDVKVKPGLTSIETPDKANAVYLAGYVFPMKDSDADYPAIVVGNFVLGSGGLSSRLGDRIRQQEGLSYTIFTSFGARAKDARGSFTVVAICNPANMTKLRKLVKEEVARLIKDGVTEKELEAAKSGYLQRQQIGRTNDGGLAVTLASNLYLDRTMAFQADLESKIGSLTTQQVNAAVKRHLTAKKLFVTIAGDFKGAASKEDSAKKKSKGESKNKK